MSPVAGSAPSGSPHRPRSRAPAPSSPPIRPSHGRAGVGDLSPPTTPSASPRPCLSGSLGPDSNRLPRTPRSFPLHSSLVAMDVAGEQQIDVVSNLVKTRRDLAGNKLGVGEHVGWGCAVSNLCLAFNVDHIAPFNLQPVSGRHTSGPGASKEESASHPLLLARLVELDDEHLRRKMVGKCGPCFLGHKDMEEAGGQCCNSCADVQSVFKRKALRRLKWDEHPLCRHEALLADPVRGRSLFKN